MNPVQFPADTVEVIAPTGGVLTKAMLAVYGLVGPACVAAAQGLAVNIDRIGIWGGVKQAGFIAKQGRIAFYDLVDQRFELSPKLCPIGFYAADAASDAVYAEVVLDPAGAAARLQEIIVDLSLTANGTWEFVLPRPSGGIFLGGDIVAPDVWASALGTVLFSLKKTNAAGNTMLSSATIDLEGIADETVTDLPPSATEADRTIAAGGKVYGAIVSNNADATGPDVQGGKAALLFERVW